MVAQKFTDYNIAARTKQAILEIARDAIKGEYPRPRYATVTALDYTNRKLTVQYPDEAGTFIVSANAVMPRAIGQQVKIDGPNGARYASEVFGLANFVRLNGDTMTAPLTIDATTTAARAFLAKADGNQPSITVTNEANTPYMEWRSTDLATRYAYAQASTGSFNFVSDAGDITLSSGGGEIRTTDPLYVGGQTRAFFSGGGQYLAGGTGSVVYSAWYGAATNVDTLGSRYGFVGWNATTDMLIVNEVGTIMRFLPDGTERARVSTNAFIVGKTVFDSTTEGGYLAVATGAYVGVTGTTGAPNINLNRINAGAIAATEPFTLYRRASTQIGSVTIATGTTVAFNTTSHGPWKGNIISINDDEALTRVEAWNPVAFQWRILANGAPSQYAPPSGPIDHGFIAQELYQIQPNAVTAGRGTEEEHWDWVARTHLYSQEVALRELMTKNGAEPTHLPALTHPGESSPFVPWQTDNSKLVPDLAAAVQALIRRVRRLEQRT